MSEGDIPKALIRLKVNGATAIGDRRLAAGTLTGPDGAKHDVLADFESSERTVYFHTLEIDRAASNPRGRKFEDGRRMAVSIVFRLLHEQFGRGIVEAREKAGEILGYKEGLNRPKTIKNILDEPRTVAMMALYPVLAAVIPDDDLSETSAMLLKAGATANARGEITGRGWLWHYGQTEATFGDIQTTMEA